MKKLVCLLMAVVCIGLCSCGGTKEEPKVETTTVDLIKDRKEMLKNAYDECCDITSDYATLSYDNTSLVIDTKPDDSGYYAHESEATAAILYCNNYLKLPSSLTDKMSSTRALDGMQSQNCGDFTVSWTYHPDNGLRVIYEVNFS